MSHEVRWQHSCTEHSAEVSPTSAPGDPTLTSILFVIVFIGNLIMVTPLLVFFLERLGAERERAERLLLNVLPAEVAAELKEDGETTARHYDGISVLFADIVRLPRRLCLHD